MKKIFLTLILVAVAMIALQTSAIAATTSSALPEEITIFSIMPPVLELQTESGEIMFPSSDAKMTLTHTTGYALEFDFFPSKPGLEEFWYVPGGTYTVKIETDIFTYVYTINTSDLSSVVSPWGYFVEFGETRGRMTVNWQWQGVVVHNNN
jgi:hypothetical protein